MVAVVMGRNQRNPGNLPADCATECEPNTLVAPVNSNDVAMGFGRIGTMRELER